MSRFGQDMDGWLFESEPAGSLRLPSLPGRIAILEKIMSEAICLDMPGAFRRRAQFTFFCGDEPEDFAGYDGQLEVVGRCLEWFVFDYYIPSVNGTPAQYWLARQDEQLTADERADAWACLDFVLGLFEIIDIEPGKGLVVEDLFRRSTRSMHPDRDKNEGAGFEPYWGEGGRQRFFIEERILIEELERGQLLLARLFPYRGRYVLSGMTAVMNSSATGKIKALIHQRKLVPAYLLKDLDGIELENLFGRSLTEIERHAGISNIYSRLRRYLEEICPGRMRFSDLLELIKRSKDPFQAAATLCDTMEVFCRHEMDLLLALSMAGWFHEHKQ